MIATIVAKELALPLVPGLGASVDLPHTITQAVLHRSKIDSFNELPKEKRPPRNLWDKPHALGKYLENVWKEKDSTDTSTVFYDYNEEDVE